MDGLQDDTITAVGTSCLVVGTEATMVSALSALDGAWFLSRRNGERVELFVLNVTRANWKRLQCQRGARSP